MARVIVINQGQNLLTKLVLKQLPQVILHTDFNWVPTEGDIICWLPADNLRVDLAVGRFAKMIDQAQVKPAKIIMKSIAGTADDASWEQLDKVYGKTSQNLVMDHLYAVKMIDELEFPYTIIRTLPLSETGIRRSVLAEGEKFSGQTSNYRSAAQLIVKATELNTYKNESVGI